MGAKIARVVETGRACRAASVVSRKECSECSVVSRLTRLAARNARHVSTWQAILRSLACSFSSTIPDRKERLKREISFLLVLLLKAVTCIADPSVDLILIFKSDTI